MTDRSTDRPGRRPAPFASWLAGGVVVAVLLAVCFVVWLFGGMGRSARHGADDALAGVRSGARHAAEQFQLAAADGTLTDAEIARAAALSSGRVLQVRREAGQLSVVLVVHAQSSAAFGSTGATRCFGYAMALPLVPAKAVTVTELDSCPPASPTSASATPTG
jgi:hypothetical protein